MKTNIDNGMPSQYKQRLVIEVSNYAQSIGGGNINFIEFVNIKMIDGAVLLKCLIPSYNQLILLAPKDHRDQTNQKKEDSQIKSFFNLNEKIQK